MIADIEWNRSYRQGIAYATKMFEIFQRLATSKSVSGHGIGLAICQKIVLNHQGNIYATGQQGQGAEFCVQLPVVNPQNR